MVIAVVVCIPCIAVVAGVALAIVVVVCTTCVAVVTVVVVVSACVCCVADEVVVAVVDTEVDTDVESDDVSAVNIVMVEACTWHNVQKSKVATMNRTHLLLEPIVSTRDLQQRQFRSCYKATLFIDSLDCEILTRIKARLRCYNFKFYFCIYIHNNSFIYLPYFFEKAYGALI